MMTPAESCSTDMPGRVRVLRQVVDLLGRRQHAEALALAEAALGGTASPADPLRADFHRLAATAAQAAGRLALAESHWRGAIAVDPDDPAAWLHLGRLLAAETAGQPVPAPRLEEAIDSLGAGLARAPDDAAGWDDLGLMLMELQRPLDAEPCHRRASQLAPLDAAPHAHLGFALEAQARFAEALQSHLRALACEPDHPKVHTNYGNTLGFLGRNREAEFHHRESIRLAPGFATAHCNLGVLLADQRRDAEAEAHLREAIALRPGYPLARLNLGFLLLAQGRFAEGWVLHEARHDPALPRHGIPPPPWPCRAWAGEPLAGRSLLVWAEQGFGDQIQFARFLPLLKAAGAGRVTLVCQRPLQALFETLEGVDRVVGADVVDNAFTTGDVDLSDHQLWTFPLTLPLHLGTATLAQVPAAVPYLRAPAPVAGGSERQADGSLRIGLVWRGNPRHHNDADRSLPGLETLAPLWSVPGVRFFSLQTGAAAAVGRSPPADQPLTHLEFADFAATARALLDLDLLICVDTSSAHLAGALGVPCWLLLPDHRTDWRWLRDRDDSPWYPGRMRLFRQRRRGDWAEVVERLRQALLERHPLDRLSTVSRPGIDPSSRRPPARCSRTLGRPAQPGRQVRRRRADNRP